MESILSSFLKLLFLKSFDLCEVFLFFLEGGVVVFFLEVLFRVWSGFFGVFYFIVVECGILFGCFVCFIYWWVVSVIFLIFIVGVVGVLFMI